MLLPVTQTNYMREKEMNGIIYKKTTKADMEILMKLRLEMLIEVNDLSSEYEYEENLSLRVGDILNRVSRLRLLRLMEKLR